ncbi:MAG: insulinase family protein [Proteobacteria bacterium]|nr:insulinase family protein [Pseudomonadota bacterium]
MRYPRKLGWLFLVIFLSGCVSEAPVPATGPFPEIVKSPNDQRDYRYLELENGLKVVLISAPDADKSAASMTVFRGSFDDPADRPGLAHFLEHMLFIGTEKYPEPDGYFSYVQSHGGSSNAYTSSDHTNYFFDVSHDAFPEGLDRFAQFFISPLFQQEYVDREKNAVNSEYQLQLKEDGWRGFAVEKVATNPAHPVSQFNIGTLETLDGDVYDALIRFFQENYSANQMGLVVLSNQSLDELEPWVSEMFAPVENRNLEPVERSMPVFKPGQLPATLRYNNIREEYGISYTFPIPSLKGLYRKKPAQYVSNLIGHEGDGSLHKLLTHKGWITSLSAGEGMIDDSNSVMSINIELTPAGAEHVPEINGYLFTYLDMLRQRPAEAWLYQEQATVAELAFRFREETQAINAVRTIAPNLREYPAEDLLIAPYLMEEFDPALIRDVVSSLRRDNVLISVSSPGYEGSETERWFGVSYDLEVGSLDIAAASSDMFTLPAPNPFLPDSLELVEGDDKKPMAVIDEAGVEIFLDTDIEFGVPRAVTNVSIRNADGLVSLGNAARSQLYASLVQDNLNALAYPALLAGVSYQIAAPPRGFRISIGGYHDKQLVLLEEVIERLLTLDIDPERFRVLKEQQLQDLANTRRERPYQQVYGRLKDELQTANWTAEDLADALEPVTQDDLMAWRDRVFEAASVQVMLVGNVTNARVSDVRALLADHLTLKAVPVAEPGVLPVTTTKTIELDIDHDDAAMVLFAQDDADSLADRARSALLVHLISPGYFSSLRTEQQLGYVVSAANPVMREWGGVGFIVQSPVAGPQVLRDRTLEFMAAQVDKLATMSEEEFGANKAGLITRLLQRDKNLAQRASRYWLDLDRGNLEFNTNQQLAEQVSKLTLEDVTAFLDDVLLKLDERYFMVISEGRFGEAGAGEE